MTVLVLPVIDVERPFAGATVTSTGMLMSAHAGFFIHPPESIVAQFPQFPVTRSYAELKARIDAAAEALRG